MRARIDSMDDASLRQSLETDIVNMTRTVNQVLDIAELEAFVVGGDSKADLQAVVDEYGRRERRYGLTTEQIKSGAK